MLISVKNGERYEAWTDPARKTYIANGDVGLLVGDMRTKKNNRAPGEIHIEYEDGCVVEHKAPQIVAIEPGHDGWVVGKEPVVLIEFDFERETVERLGMPDAHRHSS